MLMLSRAVACSFLFFSPCVYGQDNCAYQKLRLILRFFKGCFRPDVTMLDALSSRATRYRRSTGMLLILWLVDRDDVFERHRFASTAPENADVSEVAAAIFRVVDLPFGSRPFRIHIDPAQDGAEIVNGVADRV